MTKTAPKIPPEISKGKRPRTRIMSRTRDGGAKTRHDRRGGNRFEGRRRV